MATGGARPKAPKVQRAATIATESARSQENSTTGEEIPKVQKTEFAHATDTLVKSDLLKEYPFCFAR